MFSSKIINKLAGATLLLLATSSQNSVEALLRKGTRVLEETVLEPVDDAYVWEGSRANKKYGLRDTLIVRKVNNSNRKAVLKFELDDQWDVSDLSATLRVYVSSAQSTQPTTIKVARLADDPDWEETTVTWNTLSGISVVDIGNSFSVAASDAGRWVEVDVSDLLRNSGGDTLSLALEATNGRRCDFSSKDGQYSPELILTSSGDTPTPPPSPIETPRVFTLGDPIMSGTGCPEEHSVGVLATPDGSKVTVMFQDYWADTENDQKYRVRKNCAISIPVTILDGYSIGIFQADYRGYVYVPDTDGMEATFNAEYFFAGIYGPKQTTTWLPGSEEDFTLTDRVAAVAYSPCGDAEHNLRINTSIIAKGLSQEDGGTVIQIDTADITNPYSVNVPLFSFDLYTRRCPSANERIFQQP